MSKKIKSLNEEVMMVQLEDYVTRVENKMNNQINKNKKEFLKAIIPMIIGIILSLITLNPIFISGGTLCLALSAIIKMIKDDKEHDKEFNAYLNSLNPNSKVLILDSEKPIDFLIHDKIITKSDSYFYTPEFKNFVEKEEQSIKVVEPPKENVYIDDDFASLNKDEVMKQIVYEYDAYCNCYNLPKMPITPKEWDALFDTIFKRLEEVNLENRFYDYMSFLQRYTFAYALLHKHQSITIHSYLNQMHMFEKVGFTGLDIESIIKEINEKIGTQTNKVVNLSKNYQPKK